MKKLVVLFPLIILIQLAGITQYSFRVFPAGVLGDPYADTLLNTRAVLIAAGVQQVNAWQTSPEITKSFASKTVKLNKDGSIGKMSICFAKNKETGFTHCIDDSIWYEATGRMAGMKTTDNRGNKFPPPVIIHAGEKQINVLSMGMQPDDSSVSYQSYNEKGQLVKLIRTWKGREIENTLFYYNNDGLLDSTNNTNWGTFLFKRKKKGKGKLIETTNSKWSYQWIYNQAGQCISNTVFMKYSPGDVHESGYKGDLKFETNYFYNTDGTLLKAVTTSSDKPPVTMNYSYIK